MSKATDARTRRTREKILTAAETMFLKNGYVGTNMDDLAAAAAVSKQTVYAHFGSKEALFLDIVETMTGGPNRDLKARIDAVAVDVPVDQFLLNFAIEQLTIVLTPRLMQLRRMVIGETGRFPELGHLLHRRGPALSIDWLAEAFEHYAVRGALKIDDPKAAAAYFNWIVMGGPTNDAMFLGDGAIPPKRALRRHAAESVRIFLAAYSPTDDRP